MIQSRGGRDFEKMPRIRAEVDLGENFGPLNVEYSVISASRKFGIREVPQGDRVQVISRHLACRARQ